jgi:hypothetical protein
MVRSKHLVLGVAAVLAACGAWGPTGGGSSSSSGGGDDGGSTSSSASSSSTSGSSGGFDAAGQCTSNAQCPGGACSPGGGTVGCGACRPSDCNIDTDCADAGAQGARMVCLHYVSCICGGNGGICSPACTADSCGTASSEICGADGHCTPKPCTADADCPRDYACDATKTCLPKKCSANADCGSADYCINGECYAEPGYCAGLAP